MLMVNPMSASCGSCLSFGRTVRTIDRRSSVGLDDLAVLVSDSELMFELFATRTLDRRGHWFVCHLN